MRIFLHRGAGGGGEEGLFGRVAKICRVRSETFLQRKKPGSIDTFRVSMIKYNENKTHEKRRRRNAAQNVRKSEKAVCSRFCGGFGVSFFCGLNFSLFRFLNFSVCGKVLFFAHWSAHQTQGGFYHAACKRCQRRGPGR